MTRQVRLRNRQAAVVMQHETGALRHWSPRCTLGIIVRHTPVMLLMPAAVQRQPPAALPR